MSQEQTPPGSPPAPAPAPTPVPATDAATPAADATTAAPTGFAGTKLSKETVVLILLVWGLFLMSIVWYLVQPKDQATPELANQWLAAVQIGDHEAAALTANDMVREDTDKLVNPNYRALANATGVNPMYLELPFNQADAMAWDQAIFFHGKARELLKNLGPEDDPIHVLITGLWAQVKPESAELQTIEWPKAGWLRGRATPEHMAWMMAELAYQIGFEVLILRLDDAEGKPVAFMCEMRHHQGVVYLADPAHGTLTPRSLNSLLDQEEEFSKMWPKNPELFAALKTAQYFVPAMPQDYCLRNQKLAEYLGRLLGGEAPRFGQDPYERASLFQVAWGTEMAKQEFPVNLWDRPFKLFFDDIVSQQAAP